MDAGCVLPPGAPCRRQEAGGQPPEDIHVRIPATCERVTGRGQRDFTDGTRVKDCDMGRLSGVVRSPRPAQCKSQVPGSQSGDGAGERAPREKVTGQSRGVAGSEDGGREPGAGTREWASPPHPQVRGQEGSSLPGPRGNLWHLPRQGPRAADSLTWPRTAVLTDDECTRCVHRTRGPWSQQQRKTRVTSQDH